MYDLVVIGSGPGGYVAAIRAAQLGMNVACVEKYDTFGGTCLNVGCIPSKALLESSHKFHDANGELAEHGINVSGVELDLEKMLNRKKEVVNGLTGGIKFLFGKNKVDGIHGTATIQDKNTVVVAQNNGESKTLETKKILIATGSKPTAIPGVEYDKETIVDSTWALEFTEVPEHLIIIGAGVIGLELGSVWSRLGAKVTVIEYLPEILGGRADAEVMKTAKKIFTKQGLEFIMNAKVTGAKVNGKTVEVSYEPRDGEEGEVKTIEGSKLMVAVGRRPYTDGLGLVNIGLETNARGFIEVDGDYETSVEGVYAIGDVIPGPMLAHLAEDEGIICVERMNGMGSHVMYDAVPDVVYTYPEIASVGKTPAELDKEGVEYKTGKFLFKANGRARAINYTDGFVKVLADAKTDRILGAHIIGPQAGDLIAEMAVAMEFWASAEDIARSSHAHPSLAEVVKEACLAVDGRMIHS
ncbi:dihydrolipoamide dehydrogenase [Bradymonas sediminis]|uniref:Dihydrolipoyl dehydrogenase n=2 Tax=Bradymonas sediminis TaxID=1548548 RepID=A0A2Z4FPB7_9DELT|nr:dihydrolipoyl dehydrogenase [Bradymonas sediminis]AWV90528.1 dihydrolipoyl dehydrogenase [Bradymonas sediminis]TDP72079.1 dihydrolipoamide dehydrogenase [Bradymonas sediminis]